MIGRRKEYTRNCEKPINFQFLQSSTQNYILKFTFSLFVIIELLMVCLIFKQKARNYSLINLFLKKRLLLLEHVNRSIRLL
jgi:hypothetical protein